MGLVSLFLLASYQLPFFPSLVSLKDALKKNITLTPKHVSELTWEPAQAPHWVRPIEVRYQTDHPLHGHIIAYVPPQETFREALEVLLGNLRAADNPDLSRMVKRLNVSGPTGSGKSRLGWELYQAVRDDETANLDACAYVDINLAKQTHIQSAADLVQYIVRSFGFNEGERASAARLEDTVTLAVVARAITGWEAGRRTALFLHVDEFQRAPDVVLALQDAVAKANDVLKRDGCTVVTVCTGLYTPEFADVKNLDASDGSVCLHLGYFSQRDARGQFVADDATSWQLARAAAHASLGAEVLPATLADVPATLRFLVEDVDGWPMGAVQLGAQLALREPLRHAAQQKRHLEAWGDVDFAACEHGLNEVLAMNYSKPAGELLNRLTYPGVMKLVALVLSPFSVRL